MHYPLVIHKEPNSCYGVIVPDLPGCHSAGDTLAEAIEASRVAIQGHVESLIDNHMEVPEPQPAETHLANPDYAGADYWAVVEVDMAAIGKAKRINISMQERILTEIDDFAEHAGESRSGLLQRAATDYIARHREAETA